MRRLIHALIRGIKEWCAKRNVPLSMVGCYSARYGGGIYDRLKHMAEAEGVPFLHPQEPLSALASSDLERFAIKNDGHPTEKVIGLMGERIWDWLKPRLVADLP